MGYTKEKVDNRLEDLQDADYISDSNKQTVLQFIDFLRAEGNTSRQRNYKYIYLLDTIFKEYVDFDLKEATKAEMRRAVGRINASDKSDWTKNDYKTAIKKLYRTIYEDKMDRPDRIKKILNANYMKRGNIERKHEIEALTPEEVMDMSRQATNSRDRLLPVLFFETGARVSEIRDIEIQDIDLQERYADVTIPTLKNNKGDRRLTLTSSVGLLTEWLEEHPRANDPESKLLVNICDRKGRHAKQMTRENIAQILESQAKKAEINKRITPHVLRHSAATYYATERNWSVSRLCFWMGWKDSSMAEVYCKENADRMKRQKLKEEGIDNEENDRNILTGKKCSRCGSQETAEKQFCSNCSLSLSKDTAEEAKKIREAAEVIVRELKDGSSIEDIVS